MSQAQASKPALIGLAVLSIILFAASERSVHPVRDEAYAKKMEAVRLMERAERVIFEHKRAHGIAIDEQNDPERSGLIGPQFSLITTDRGSQAAKMLAGHPNFAAAVTQMMLQAKVDRGDLVAVGVTGSMPGFNIAVLSACQAIGVHAVLISSVGSSMFGATDPDFTWLDMEKLLAEKGLWSYRSRAASLGGGGDIGRGLSPEGRRLLTAAMARNSVPQLPFSGLIDDVQRRVALYDSVSAANKMPIKLYINVGGGLASLGGTQNSRLIPAGLSFRLASLNYPNRGVINILNERRIPVLHLLEAEKLAREYGIVDANEATVSPGTGLLFSREFYDLRITGISAALVLLVCFLTLRADLRQQILGKPHPEELKRP